MFCDPLPHSFSIEILILNLMVLGSGALSRYLSHGSGAIMTRISALLGDPTELSCPFYHVRM